MMEKNNVCNFNKFGYCKFGNTCQRKHVNVTCENKACEISDCFLRHPRECSFFKNFKYCKFGLDQVIIFYIS